MKASFNQAAAEEVPVSAKDKGTKGMIGRGSPYHTSKMMESLSM
jgi:hypothetical protein